MLGVVLATLTLYQFKFFHASAIIEVKNVKLICRPIKQPNKTRTRTKCLAQPVLEKWETNLKVAVL